MAEDQASISARCRDEKMAKKMNLPFRFEKDHQLYFKRGIFDQLIPVQHLGSDQQSGGHLQRDAGQAGPYFRSGEVVSRYQATWKEQGGRTELQEAET